VFEAVSIISISVIYLLHGVSSEVF
jgi:hypothetical protein